MAFGKTRCHLCVRLDNYAVSLDVLRRAHLLKEIKLSEEITRTDTLNSLLTLPREQLQRLRERLSELLGRGEHLNVEGAIRELSPYPQDDPSVKNPLCPRDFVDFYCSRHHAHRVGCLFRGPENALPEQYFHLPIGYHGRSSTVVVSGANIERPQGIVGADSPQFQPTARLDYELEVGFVLRGHRGRLTPDKAWDLIFGVVLVNDWSARDIQAFEYKPLGPFLGKSFATSIGAWITPLEALSDWRGPNLDSQHPVLPHLAEANHNHLDLPLSATLLTERGAQTELCSSNLKHLAWSAAQMVAHLSSNGTVISAGDLIATGTVSGPEKGARACLLERSEGGKKPLTVGSEERIYLADGDTVTLLGGHPGIGLAPCRGTVIPSPAKQQQQES